MAQIGIYGGSFNPVHWGHIGLAEWVAAHTDLAEVWLMVSPNNPLKDPGLLADEQQRLEQVRNAVAGRKGLVASDFEFRLPRPSYTAETLRALAKAYPQHTFTLLIGEDNWALFDRWRDAAYILDNYRIFVYPRHGCPTPPVIHRRTVHYLQDAPCFDISSTELRNNLDKSK